MMLPNARVSNNLLLYFGHVPAEGAGSAIIVYRHLKRFSDAGWTVRIVADWGQDLEPCKKHGWATTTLSHRKPWWPPFNPDSACSRRLRAWLWAGEVKDWLGGTQATAVLTYLSAFSDTLSIAAVGFARRQGLPLASLVHDDSRCFLQNQAEGKRAHARRQWILTHSGTAHFASPELASIFALKPEQIQVLPPIPEGCSPRHGGHEQPQTDSAPLLVYAGNYWPVQLPALARISTLARDEGCRCLCILKPNTEHTEFLRKAGADCRPPFPSNVEALEFLKANAGALLASYADSTEEMPWIRTSFPSKVIEYCHLGIPLFIIAPEDSAIMKWARRNDYPFCASPIDTVALQLLIRKLHDPKERELMGSLALKFAQSEFAPTRIHAQLESSLLTNAKHT